jgi:hypothetical protein
MRAAVWNCNRDTGTTGARRPTGRADVPPEDRLCQGDPRLAGTGQLNAALAGRQWFQPVPASTPAPAARSGRAQPDHRRLCPAPARRMAYSQSGFGVRKCSNRTQVRVPEAARNPAWLPQATSDLGATKPSPTQRCGKLGNDAARGRARCVWRARAILFYLDSRRVIQ